MEGINHNQTDQNIHTYSKPTHRHLAHVGLFSRQCHSLCKKWNNTINKLKLECKIIILSLY